MDDAYSICTFNSVTKFIHSLPDKERLKIAAAIRTLSRNNFISLHVKTLRGPMKELIVKKRRIIFFTKENTIYFIRAFTKRTAKTPKREIEYAEEIVKKIQ